MNNIHSGALDPDQSKSVITTEEAGISAHNPNKGHIPTPDDWELTHSTYTHLLSKLGTDDETLEYLKNNRGFGDLSDSLQYKSSRFLKKVATDFIKDVKEGVISFLPASDIDRLKFVPGFRVDKRYSNSFFFCIDTEKTPGIVIPLYNERKQIHALKLRAFQPLGDAKYFYVAHDKTDPNGIYFPAGTYHIPPAIDLAKIEEVRIVEGEIKSDVANLIHNDVPTISIGGISVYKDIVRVLARYKNIQKARIAFDSDAWCNPEIHDRIRSVKKGKETVIMHKNDYLLESSSREYNENFIRHLHGLTEKCLTCRDNGFYNKGPINKHGGSNSSQFLQVDKMKGIEPFYERWDNNYKGLDDYLLHCHKSSITPEIDLYDRAFLEAEKISIKQLIGMPQNCFYSATTKSIVKIGLEETASGGSGYRIEEMDIKSYVTSRDNKLNISEKELGMHLIKPWFGKFNKLIYAPQVKSSFIFSESDTGVCLNTAIPSPIVPKKGNISLWHEHFNILFPDSNERQIVHDFIAYNIRNIGQKIRWALVLIGNQGTGKSTVFNIIKHIIGKHNVKNPLPRELQGQFNAFFHNCSLMVVEEFSTDEKVDFKNLMKTFITNEDISVNAKYKTAVEIPNITNIVLLTNDSRALMPEENERRYGVIQCTDKKESDEYFTRLHAWGESEEGKSALAYYYLHEHEFGNQFNAFSNPHTKAYFSIMENRYNNVETVVRSMAGNEAGVFGSVKVVTYADASAIFNKRLGRGHENNLSPRHYADALKQFKFHKVQGSQAGQSNIGGFDLENGKRVYTRKETLYITPRYAEKFKAIPEDQQEDFAVRYIQDTYGSRIIGDGPLLDCLQPNAEYTDPPTPIKPAPRTPIELRKTITPLIEEMTGANNNAVKIQEDIQHYINLNTPIIDIDEENAPDPLEQEISSDGKDMLEICKGDKEYQTETLRYRKVLGIDNLYNTDKIRSIDEIMDCYNINKECKSQFINLTDKSKDSTSNRVHFCKMLSLNGFKVKTLADVYKALALYFYVGRSKARKVAVEIDNEIF